MAGTKQHNRSRTADENPYGVDWELIHVITSLPIDIERLTEILDAGADPDTVIKDDARGLNVLQYASLHGHIEVVQLLLDRGASPDRRGGNHVVHTALGISCENGYTDIARLLIERGADVNKTNTDERTPLHKTAIKGRPDTARLLLDHGAKANTKDLWGYTPLHLACQPGRPDVVRVLLAAGADVTMKDLGGDTPLDDAMALSVDNPFREEILDLFRDHSPEAVMEAYCSPGSGGMR